MVKPGFLSRNKVDSILLFLLITLGSCLSNEIYFDSDQSMIFSCDGYRLKSVEIRNDNSEEFISITIKSGEVGDYGIAIGKVSERYNVIVNGAAKEDRLIRLKPSSKYTITNFSIGDAGMGQLTVATDENGDIIASEDLNCN